MDAATTYYENAPYDDEQDIQTETLNSGNLTERAMTPVTTSLNPYIYPVTRRDDSAVDSYNGDIKVVDPYRWLENPDSEETQTFIEEQNEFSQSFLERANWRDTIRAKLTEMWDFKKTECPKQFGSRFFFLENSGLQNQPVLYVTESLHGAQRPLLDPNELSDDGAASISYYSVSPSGEHVAYSLSENGSDWSAIYIKNVASGHNFLEVLNYTKSTTIQWRNDNRTFFYSRYPKTKVGKVSGQDFSLNLNQKLYLHKIGTRQDDDILVADFPDHPTWAVSSQITLDSQFLLLYAGDYVGEQHTFYMDIGRKGSISKDIEKYTLFPESGIHKYLANDDDTFYFLTNTDAPKFKIVSFELAESTQKDQWTTIVSENEVASILWARVVANDKVAICYNEHLDTRLEIRQLGDGELVKAIVFDDNISPWDHFCQRDSSDLFIRVESYTNPGMIYQLNVGNNEDGEVESDVYYKAEIPYFISSIFVNELVFYSNDDGENIPLNLMYQKTKENEFNGTIPCLLIGHGAFGKSLLPEFNFLYALFAQNFDGVVAIANIRGGGEYGTKWWNDARIQGKESAIEDFASAANFLINNKYTRASQLTIMGTSHGATNIAAVINRRPELFGAAIVDVGIMDLLRLNKFTVGHLFTGEYGNVNKEEDLRSMLRYSPLHNIIPPSNYSSSYPAILVTTADHDDRVVPSHSYKYIAELQHTVGQTIFQSNPLMIRVYQNIGHDEKLIPTSKAIEKITDIFSFLENSLHYEFHF